MNGRIYDPAIARFISADPTIPYVFDSQSFNRYSYTRNNPLKYIDLNGFHPDSINSPENTYGDKGHGKENIGSGTNGDGGGDWYSKSVAVAKKKYFESIGKYFGSVAEMNARIAAGAFESGMSYADYSNLLWNISINENFSKDMSILMGVYNNIDENLKAFSLSEILGDAENRLAFAPIAMLVGASINVAIEVYRNGWQWDRIGMAAFTGALPGASVTRLGGIMLGGISNGIYTTYDQLDKKGTVNEKKVLEAIALGSVGAKAGDIIGKNVGSVLKNPTHRYLNNTVFKGRAFKNSEKFAREGAVLGAITAGGISNYE